MMNRDNISIVFFGLLPIGFSTYPNKFTEDYETYNLNKSFGEVDCLYKINKGFASVIYIVHGLVGESNKSEPRGGRNFGFSIEIQDYQIPESQIQNLFQFMKSVFEKAILNESSGIFKTNTIPYYFQIYSFNDIYEYLDTISNVIKQQFYEKIGKFEIIENLNRNATYELVPEKIEERRRIEMLKKEEEQILIKQSKLNKVKNDKLGNSTISTVSKEFIDNFLVEKNLQSKTQIRVNYALIGYSLMLSIFCGFIYYRFNDIIQGNKRINFQLTEIDAQITKLTNAIPTSDNAVEVVSEKGVYKFYLNRDKYINYVEAKELKIKDANELIDSIASYLVTESSNLKSRLIIPQEIVKFIKTKNNKDVGELNIKIQDALKNKKDRYLIINKTSNSELIPIKLIVHQTQ